MNKKLKYLIASFTFIALLFITSQNTAHAASLSIALDDNYENHVLEVNMPKDGVVKLNANFKDNGLMPGKLTIAIKTGYSESSELIEEITGITSTDGITDMDISLKKGRYYFHYILGSETGDLTDVEISLTSEIERVPTKVENISKLTVYTPKSLEIDNIKFDKVKFGEADVNVVIPFTVSKTDAVLITMNNKSTDKSIDARVYKDKDCITPIGETFTLKPSLNSIQALRALPNNGTYYIKFTNKKPSIDTIVIDVNVCALNGNNKSLVTKKIDISYQDTKTKKITYKFTIKSKSSFAVAVAPLETDKSYTANFRLYDKNKKAITKLSKVNSPQQDNGEFGPIMKYYTLSPGTYYLQVNTSLKYYTIISDSIKATNAAGSTSKTAKEIKVGKAPLDGYITASDKSTKVDWYKFKVNSFEYLKIGVNYLIDGTYDFAILDSKFNTLFLKSEEFSDTEGNFGEWVSNYFEKGTYYIKVYKRDSSSSIYYDISVTQ